MSNCVKKRMQRDPKLMNAMLEMSVVRTMPRMKAALPNKAVSKLMMVIRRTIKKGLIMIKNDLIKVAIFTLIICFSYTPENLFALDRSDLEIADAMGGSQPQGKPQQRGGIRIQLGSPRSYQPRHQPNYVQYPRRDYEIRRWPKFEIPTYPGYNQPPPIDYSRENADLKRQIEELKRQNAEKDMQYKNIDNEYNKLREDYNRLIRSNERLREKIQDPNKIMKIEG